MLEAARNVPELRAVVVVTSDKCYRNSEKAEGYRENDPLGGYDPYSASKGCQELVAASYRDSFLRAAGVGLATARAGNVIGGGDWAGRPACAGPGPGGGGRSWSNRSVPRPPSGRGACA